jgi:hypothetical protein
MPGVMISDRRLANGPQRFSAARGRAFASVLVGLLTAAAAAGPVSASAQEFAVASALARVDRQAIVPRPLFASDIALSPGAYFDKNVQVRSAVKQAINRHVFVLSDQPLLAAPDVLVLVPEPLSPAAEDYIVMVTGTVRPFNAGELQREFSWFHPELFHNNRMLDRWQKDRIPVIIAASVRTETGLELAQTPGLNLSAVGSSGMTSMQGKGGGGGGPVTTLGTLFRAGNGRAFSGSPIAISGIRLLEWLNPQFVLVGTDSQHPILVHLPTPQTPQSLGSALDLSGVVRELPRPLQSWSAPLDASSTPGEQAIYIEASQIARTQL